MGIDRFAALGLCALAVSACQRAPDPHAGASLVELSREAPGEDFERVGGVSCVVEERLPKEQMLSQCRTSLLDKAAQLDADVVVVEAESSGTAACPACLRMTGSAFRRVLPYERAVSTPTRTQIQTPAALRTGTGFVVAPNGLVLTANHVVDGARTIAVSLNSGGHAIANVSRRLESLDMALLKIQVSTPRYLSLGDASSIGLGERVWTLGFPVTSVLGIEPKFTDGSISAVTGPKDSPEFFQMTAPIQPGNSGGPLLTETGYAVGIVTATADAIPFLRATGALPQGINWAVKTDAVKPLFDQPPRLAPTASRAQAVDHTKAAVCLIEAIDGEGLLVAPAGFGSGFNPRQVSADSFDRQRERCERRDAAACLSVARILVPECKASAEGGCRHARFGRTLLSHACGTGRHVACAALRE